MREAPGDESVLLLVGGVTLGLVTLHAGADPPQGTVAGLALLLVVVAVDQLPSGLAVLQDHHLEG